MCACVLACSQHACCHRCRCFIVSNTFLPFRRGETPLQNFNSVLSLWKLQELADACLLFNNDQLLAQAESSRGQAARYRRAKLTSFFLGTEQCAYAMDTGHPCGISMRLPCSPLLRLCFRSQQVSTCLAGSVSAHLH